MSEIEKRSESPIRGAGDKTSNLMESSRSNNTSFLNSFMSPGSELKVKNAEAPSRGNRSLNMDAQKVSSTNILHNSKEDGNTAESGAFFGHENPLMNTLNTEQVIKNELEGKGGGKEDKDTLGFSEKVFE